MKKRKETINREVLKAENGFEIIKERKSHIIKEGGEKVGAGGNLNSVSKIITPNEEELKNMEEVFDWMAENYEDNRKISIDFNRSRSEVSKRVGRQA